MLTSYQTQRATETGLRLQASDVKLQIPLEEAQGEAHNPGLSKGAFRCEPNAPTTNKTKWKKIDANHIPTNALISKIYKELKYFITFFILSLHSGDCFVKQKLFTLMFLPLLPILLGSYKKKLRE